MAKKLSDLEEAILNLPMKEKDKLLLRLVMKDKKLVSKLEYELVDSLLGEHVLENRRAEIIIDMSRFLTKDYIYWDSPGELMMILRSINSMITEHVRVTKDKLGGIDLTLKMLITAFERYGLMLMEKQRRCENFSPYVVKRMLDTVKKIEKLHEDYRFDFRDQVNQMVDFLRSHPPSKHAADDAGLDLNYL